jgi:hypothetical protein
MVTGEPRQLPKLPAATPSPDAPDDQPWKPDTEPEVPACSAVPRGDPESFGVGGPAGDSPDGAGPDGDSPDGAGPDGDSPGVVGPDGDSPDGVGVVGSVAGDGGPVVAADDVEDRCPDRFE